MRNEETVFSEKTQYTIYGYAVMQLCSFKMRGVKRDEEKFYYYNNYIFSKKSTQDGQAGKK